MKKVLIILGVVITLVVLITIYIFLKQDNLGGGPGRTAQACDVISSTVVNVGPASGGVHIILAAHSLRAWAIIQRLDNATTTVSLSFDEGAAAVLGEGFHINTTTPESIPFGANTDFVYTGEVTGVAIATTSVQVIECRY